MKKILLIIFLFFFSILNINALTESVIDITKMDVFELQEAVDNDLINYETITKLYLDRINEYDKDYKSIITINEKAIEEAKKCDEIYQKEGRKSLLFGIPIIAKDNIDVYGIPTTGGTKSLSDNYPNDSAKLIQNLIDKGAIVLAKANMSELALMASSSVSSYGTVRNAYNIDYSSYGSSGGTAVSIALSFATLGIGTDTNMSVRGPSSANNLYGMRPTFESVSNKGMINYDITRDTAGPMTKTARENALLLAVMQGENENKYLNNNSPLKGKRIGVLKQFVDGNGYGLEKTNSDIKDLFYDTVKILKDNGAEIIEIDNFWKGSYADISNTSAAGWTMCYTFNQYIKNTTGTIKNFTSLASSKGHVYSLWIYNDDCGTKVDDSIFEKYNKQKSPYKKAYEELFKKNNLDAVIYPTMGNKISKIGNSTINSNASHIAPVLGVPAITIPMGEIDGLYYGFDLVGLENSENKLYDIAAAYNKINNTYKLPNEVPNLYKITENVTKLKELYLSNKDNTFYTTLANKKIRKEYQNLITETKEYFKKYSDIENKNKEALKLINKYKAIDNKIKLNSVTYIIETIILFILGFITFMMLIISKRNFKRA